MNEARRGRPPQRFAIERIRLIGFHNFVDETIDVNEAGHLFLLGDNGSGKTTVLDAIHMVLTGALGIELNAAARVAGGREAGRTLQGIVLRFDQERGVMNEGGAIAYAALELVDASEGATLVAGVGIEATTMDADVVRWGFLRRCRLEDLALVEATQAGKHPVTREALRGAVDKTELFARMSDYRRAIADRLFGGSALYEEVCRFWAMAKAYREIVAKARDFGGLFARLLPAPNRETFVDILRSARALDELEDALGQLEQQRQYVAGLAALASEIASLRETMARYRWLAVYRRLDEAAASLAAARRELASRRLEVERGSAAVRAAHGAYAQAAAALSAARAADVEGLAARIQQAEAQVARERGDAASARQRALERESELERTQSMTLDAAAARDSTWRAVLSAARAAANRLRTLEVLLAQVDAELGREEERSRQDPADAPLPPLTADALAEAEAVARAARATSREVERRHATCEAKAAELRKELELLESRREEIPMIDGFAAAREALSDAGIAAHPLYEMLEPKNAAPKGALAAVEALAGDATLAAFLVSPEERDRARAIALQHPGARVVARTAADILLPDWIQELLSTRSGDDAVRALATELAQPASLGVLGGPDALSGLEHRGFALRVHADEPRLLGAQARRRAHEARLRATRQALDAAEEEVRRQARATADAGARCQDASNLVGALAALRGQALLEKQHALMLAAAGRESVREQLGEARARTDESDRRVVEAERLLDALRARARAAGLQEIERRIAELTCTEEVARNAELDAAGRAEVVRKEVEAAERGEADAANQVASLGTELVARGAELRARLDGDLAHADDAAIEHYARVTQRGDQFRSIGAIEDRLRGAETDEAVLCGEIQRDGSRGVRNLQWAGRFGFTWIHEEARIEDRRGEPIANVLAHIDRDIAEQRQVVNDKTRELMDRLVMGALARELQEHVERLHRTVREINGLLEPLRFGSTRYQFRVTPRSDRTELVALVRKMSVLDPESRTRFREFVEERLEEMKRLDDDTEIPELLDYRRWFDYRLAMRSTGADDTELTRELRALGSGGEQGVPNYLLVLALARLMFDNAGARVRPLLFDEAFYGIDAGRRDQLLRFATELGLQLVVASPDQDGVTPAVRRTTTLFLVKDDEGDVHLAPYHYFNDSRVAQRSLLADRPEEPAPEAAVCVVGTSNGTASDRG